MPFDPWSTGLAVFGTGANALAERSAAKAQKEAMRRQAQLIGLQSQQYRQAMPTYQSLLASGAQYAGVAPGQHQMQPLGGQMGSAWGNPEDQLRFAAAQDQINRRAQQGQNQLQATLARRGIASSSIGAALAQNQRSAQRDLGGFQRQLAIEAPHEMERRRAALAGLLNPAFGQGAAASAGYGQQGQIYGQQAGQAAGGIQDILAQYGYQRALGQHPSPHAVSDGMNPKTGMPYGEMGTDWFIDENGEIQYT
jgi:hypothetical protein